MHYVPNNDGGPPGTSRDPIILEPTSRVELNISPSLSNVTRGASGETGAAVPLLAHIATSLYPCPMWAADIFEPQPTPPPIYYLKDHPRVVYDDSDWPTTGDDEAEVNVEEGGSASSHVSTVVRLASYWQG